MASLASRAITAVKGYAAGIPGDAAKLKNTKRVFNASGAKGVGTMLARNKAVQAGAGLLGAGAVTGAAMSKKKSD